MYAPPGTAVSLLLPCSAAGRGFCRGRRLGCFHLAAAPSLPPGRCAAGPRLWRHAAVAACLRAFDRRTPWGRRGCGARAPPQLLAAAAGASAADHLGRQRPILLALPTPPPKDKTATAFCGSGAICFFFFARAAIDGSLPRAAVFPARVQPLHAGGGLPKQRRQIASARLWSHLVVVVDARAARHGHLPSCPVPLYLSSLRRNGATVQLAAVRVLV